MRPRVSQSETTDERRDGDVSTWQRWTIDEIDLGVARLAVAQARYPLESTVAEAEATEAEHHCSKRGINLELIERLGDSRSAFGSTGPPLLISSCASDADSGYGFPHAVTQNLLREVRDPQAEAGGDHAADDELGIHLHVAAPGRRRGGPAGTIAYVMRANGTASLYRMCDGVDDVRLSDARKLA